MKIFTLMPLLGLTVALQPLNKRQLETVPCSDMGMKDCGQACIDLTDTCCPDQSGGCPVNAECQKGSNGRYGCCPKGEDCVGQGGANTRVQIIDGTAGGGLGEPTDVPTSGSDGDEDQEETVPTTTDSTIPTSIPEDDDGDDLGIPDVPNLDGPEDEEPPRDNDLPDVPDIDDKDDKEDDDQSDAGGSGGEEETSSTVVPDPSPTGGEEETTPSPAAAERNSLNVGIVAGFVVAMLAFAV